MAAAEKKRAKTKMPNDRTFFFLRSPFLDKSLSSLGAGEQRHHHRLSGPETENAKFFSCFQLWAQFISICYIMSSEKLRLSEDRRTRPRFGPPGALLDYNNVL